MTRIEKINKKLDQIEADLIRQEVASMYRRWLFKRIKEINREYDLNFNKSAPSEFLRVLITY